MKKLSPYQVTWAIITAKSGIVTKADMKKLGITNRIKPSNQPSFAFRHFNTKDAVLAFVDKTYNLGKEYEVRFINDRQFKDIEITYNPNTWTIPYSEKQKREVYILK